MRIFIQDHKTNFVDERDVLVGFDDQYNSCCETFGYFFTGDEPTADTIQSIEDQIGERDYEADEFAGFYFDPDYFKEFGDYDGGGYAVFRLVHHRMEHDSAMRRKDRAGRPHVFLVLFNHHNGYYGHGFSFKVPGREVVESGL